MGKNSPELESDGSETKRHSSSGKNSIKYHSRWLKVIHENISLIEQKVVVFDIQYSNLIAKFQDVLEFLISKPKRRT